MMKRTAMLFAVLSVIGCGPTDLLRPPIPNVPPTDRPASKSNEKANASTKVEETRAIAPVTPSQVNDKSAHDVARALDAELDREANAPAPKP